MTKIFAYIPTPGGMTGGPRRLLTLADALEKRGVSVCVASQTGSELLQFAKAKGYETTSLDPVGGLGLGRGSLFRGGILFRFKTGLEVICQNLRVRRQICSCSADAVWVRGSKGIAFAAFGAVLSRKPLIWDVDYELPSRGVVRLLHRLGLWASKAVVFQYSAAGSAIFGADLSGKYRNKFRASIPGIDLGSVEPFRAARGHRTKEQGAPFVVFQVGTVCERKNQAATIEAFRILKEQGVHGRRELWLAYDEIQDRNLLDRVREYGMEYDVKFLGWRDDVKELMAQADVLVMPSRDEGVPNAVQEAMAIGLPVLVSEAGGMPEIVRDKETGWVLEMNVPGAWAERIRWCQENPDRAEEVGQMAVSYAFDHFGTEAWGKAYARILEEVTGRPASGNNS